MCQGGYTEGARRIEDIVTKAFNMKNEEIRAYFDSDNGSGSSSVNKYQCIYYVGRWHAHTLKKASSVRREETHSDLQNLIQTVFANITMNQNRIDFDAKDQDKDLPLQKVRVERVEKLGGTGTGLKLKHISDDYFIFIQRMEYIFMNLLTPEKLAMIGSGLIGTVYTELSNNKVISASIMQFTSGGVDNLYPALLHKLTLYTTRTYCRMRGKGFVRKMMQVGLNVEQHIEDEFILLAIGNFRNYVKTRN